ncbi:MAG: response regulator [Candidatus Binatia bacterium]
MSEIRPDKSEGCAKRSSVAAKFAVYTGSTMLESFLRLHQAMAGKILVVEDDAITRKNLCLLLSEEGYEVDQAGDGVQALEILASQAFDLVLSDIIMPRMDGLKLLQRVQSISPQIPVMIMTSYLSASSAPPQGAAEFIWKPFLVDDLLFKVDRALHNAALDGLQQQK